MNTPITDAAANESIVKVYETSKRLETDRAALMEALERITRVASVELTGRRDDVLDQSKSALSAARDNFPTA